MGCETDRFVWCGTDYCSLGGSAKYITRVKYPSGNYVYHQVQLSTILRSAHTVYLCVLCGSENKQRLFPYTALTDWFL
jgi:hypothetical protein